MNNLINTSNDMMLRAFCPKTSFLSNKNILFKDQLVSFDIDVEKVKDDEELLFGVVTYRAIESFLDNTSIRIKTIEKMFNDVVWTYLDQSDENIKKAAIAWVRFHGIYRRLLILINESEYITTNIGFYKTINGDRYSLKIDLILISNQKHIYVTFTPHIAMYPGMSTISNMGTLMGVEYLSEADLFPDEIIDFSYSSSLVSKNFFEKKINIKQYNLNKHVEDTCTVINNNNLINLSVCRICKGRKECFPKNAGYEK